MFGRKKEDVFLALLTRMAHNLERSGALLSALAGGGERTPAVWQELRTVQREGHRRLMEALARNLFPSLDGQDLFRLSLGLGRLLHEVMGAADGLESSARPLGPDLVQLVARVEESLRETSRAVECLARRERSRVAAATRRLYRLQDRGSRGTGATSGAKEVYSALAGIIFSCTEMVQTIHWVMVHNA